MAILEQDLISNITIKDFSPLPVIIEFKQNNRFRDRHLGHLISNLIAIQRQNSYNTSNLAFRISEYTTSLNAESSLKNGRAVSKLIAQLEQNRNPSIPINQFIRNSITQNKERRCY